MFHVHHNFTKIKVIFFICRAFFKNFGDKHNSTSGRPYQNKITWFDNFTEEMEEITINQGLVHIFEKIFLALDAKTLVKCSLVSRSLSCSLKNPRFWFKVYKQQNQLYECFEKCSNYWNLVLEISDKNELRKVELTRLLKIICIDEKEDLIKIGKNLNIRFHPLTLSIICQEFQLANYILIKFSRYYKEEERVSYILEWVKTSGNIKAFHNFAKTYKNFKIKVNAILMEHVPKVLLSYEKDVELFKEYLKIFGDSLQPNENGDTLLHFAAKYGCINIMKLLAEHSKNLNVQNQNHLTPMAFAVKKGKIGVVRFLLSINVDPNVPDKHGVTPFDYAVRNEFHKIVKLLKPYQMK